jgi:hypothetical protein
VDKEREIVFLGVQLQSENNFFFEVAHAVYINYWDLSLVLPRLCMGAGSLISLFWV